MIISELIGFFEEIMPLSWQEDYDNSGLLTGDPASRIEALLITLDVTMPVVDEAISRGCNLIISHHPLMFHGVKKLVAGNRESDILLHAIRNNIAILALHTNLDNSLPGLNGFLLGKLGATKVSVLIPKKDALAKLVTFVPVDHLQRVRDAIFSSGAGHIGNYDSCSFNTRGDGTFRALENANPFVGKVHALHSEPEIRTEMVFPLRLRDIVIQALLSAHPYEEVAYDIYPILNDFHGAGLGASGFLPNPLDETEFLQMVRNLPGVSVIRHSPLRHKPVRKIAVCTGSGSFAIPEADRQHADVLLTADLKYHDFFRSSARLLLCDIGHYESEHGVKELLRDILIEKFPNFAAFISETDTNPVQYF